jgi:PKD repeat protein
MKKLVFVLKNHFFLFILGVICFQTPLFLSAQTPCDCVPMLYESFNYDAGTTLHQKVGGTGWDGIWENQSGDTRLPGLNIGSNSLTYQTLRTHHQSLVGGLYWKHAGRSLDLSPTGALAAYRSSNGTLGKVGTTLWVSFLFQKTQNNDEQTWAALHGGNVNWYGENPSDKRLAFGYFNAAVSSDAGIRYWTLKVNANSFYRTHVPIDINAPVFVVMKLEFSASATTINLYLNPTSLGSGAEPTTPTLTVTTTEALEFRHFNTYGDYRVDNFILDEIRFASNYRCVAPDASIKENALPMARMTLTPNSGIAPLTLTLDGSTSSDTDGSLNQYEWLFGDGGRRVGTTATYTFQNTGVLYARLKVTDNCGSSSSVNQTILVTKPDGSIDCLAAPVPEAFPICDGTGGGIIRLNAGLGTTFQLTQENGTTYPFSNSRFSNLPVGNYVLTVSGQHHCKDTFRLKMPADSMNCANATANSDIMFGMNLEGLTYWDKAQPFKDYMKTSDSQLLTTESSCCGTWHSGVTNEIPVDAEGYPTVIPVQTSIGMQRVRFMVSAGGHLPMGDYIMLYEGDGRFYFRGEVTVLAGATAGRMPIQVRGIGNIYVDIEASTQGNHLRNFRLIRPQDEATYVTQPFKQDFLEKLCAFNPIRFMEWQVTNVTKLVDWSDRGKPNDRSQTMRSGASYEHMIQLGNTLNRDVWVCVPHTASDDFIRQMARLFRNQLKTSLNVYVEYSNEVWNWQFGQAIWVSENGNQNISYPRRYVERSLNVFRIWQEEWTGQTQRVRRVLGTQTGFPYISEEILAHAKGEFDYFSPTFYFGYAGDCVSQLRTLGTNATVTDVIDCTRQNMRAFFPNIRQTYRLAQLHGKPIAHYEGGQHMTSNPVVETFQQALYNSQIDPQIRTLYQEMIDSLRRYGGTTHAVAFTLTGLRESRYGSWGHVESSDQNLTTHPAPKYQVLLDNFRSVQGACDINLNALPLELIDFKAQCTPNRLIQLNWTTASEWNLKNVELQFSEDANHWQTIQEVGSKGNITTQQSYQYVHHRANPNGLVIYYRLKINELDGKINFSKVISWVCESADKQQDFSIFPNPAEDMFTIQFHSKEISTLECRDIMGRLIFIQPIDNQSSMQLSAQQLNLSAGVYYLKTDSNGRKMQRLIIL